MKITTLLILISFATQSAFAKNDPEVTDNLIIELADEIANEAVTYEHKDRAMKWAFKKLSNTYKTLNRSKKVQPPSLIADQDILNILQKIVLEIESEKHKQNKMKNAYKNMLKTLRGLERKRLDQTGLALLEISGDDPFEFGFVTVGLVAPVTFTIINSGTAEATSITANVQGAFRITGGTCTSILSLTPAENCTLDVEFAPTAAGLNSETLELNYNNNVESDAVYKELRGTGF